MGYSDYIKNLLRPLQLYELDEGFGAAEPQALGARFDEVYNSLETAEREALIPSATDAGLAAYEAILPYAPGSITLTDRRRALMALLRIDGCSFTPAALNDTLSGCGIRAVAEETATANTVRVSFPENRGVPQGYDALCARIEQILPCHLGVDYHIIYITWAELESWLLTWTELESTCSSWGVLERYSE